MRRSPISLTNIMLIVGAVIFVIYLYLADVTQIVATILSLDLRIALTAILIDLTCIGLFVLGWYLLLKNPGMSFKDCFEIVLVSIFGDLMIPTASISGEFFRVSLTVKRGKIQISEAAASVLLHRILLALTFGVVLLVSIFNLVGDQTAPFAEIYALGAIAIFDLGFGIAAMYMALRADLFERTVEKLAIKIGGFFKRFRPKYDPEKLRDSILGGFRTFVQAIKSVKPNTFILSFLVLTARWFLIAMIPYIMFISLGRPVSYWVVLGVTVFVSMVQMIPIGIPGLELKSLYERISAVEEDADRIKRELIEQLTKSAPAFLYREDFIRLIIRIDEVAELAQSISRQLSRISDNDWVPTPIVGELFERISGEVLTEYEHLRDAIMVLPMNPKKAIDLVATVHKAESKVDSSYYDADFKLLMEVKKIEQLLIYRDLLRLLEDMADLIEDASDDLRVLALHRVA